MNKIPLLLLFLTFAVYGESPLFVLAKNFNKCCCSKNAVGDKNCENILWQAVESSVTLEEFQKYVVDESGIEILCIIANTKCACGSCGMTCSGEKKGCSTNNTSDVDDLDDLLE
jgi:hypothetical protein